MNDFDDIAMFLARVGCLYVKYSLSPPFRLREFAEAWWLEGINLSHCLDQIKSHLAKNSGQYRCGSGDGGMIWLDQVIRQSWCRLLTAPRAQPAHTDGRYKLPDTFGSADGWFVDRTDPAPNTSEPIGLKQIDKAMAFLRRELADREVEAVAIEASAKVAGISPRTLDRARARLRVVSRRTGFAETGRCWVSLPTAP
jgi:hypothetical protein